jgi:hypothetical protein
MRHSTLSSASLPALALCLAGLAAAEVTVTGRIADENGVAVAFARVELRAGANETPAIATSDIAGGFTLRAGAPGEYLIHATRLGYFVFDGRAELRDGPNQLHLELNHLQDFFQSVDVAYSAPTIDADQTAEQKQLTSVEILEVPFPASQDLRNALPLLPGVVQDAAGRLHFNGGATEQTNFSLDGFNISNPVTGRFEARLSIESARTLDVESARYSADKDRGSAGSVDIRTNMGDDRWRFGATNFIPSVSSDGDLHINKWSPRFSVSGPISKGRAWFYNGFDTFYDVDTISGLPDGQNRKRSLTGSDLTRLQVNLSPSNILTGSLLVNYTGDHRTGLSFLDPVETTVNRRQTLYFTSAKDQVYFPGGALTEMGFAVSRGFLRESPQGQETFDITPFGKRGNYFVDLTRRSGREQIISNTYLAPMHWHGAHQLRFGADAERSFFDLATDRHDYRVLREDLSVARYVRFLGNGASSKSGIQIAEYVQDRWAPADGLLIEAGMRLAWDNIIHNVLYSPRLAVAYAPKWLHDTKVAAGVGIFHDALTLGIFGRQNQASLSTFFDPVGRVTGGPLETAFQVDARGLGAPSYRTVSVSVERKLIGDFYGKASYIGRAGQRGLTFAPDPGAIEAAGQFEPVPADGLYRLRNLREDRYDAFELTVRRTFGGKFEWVGSYTRSSARSNAIVDYSLENPIFAAQAPGHLAWDTPNRLLSWGWAPIPKSILPRALAFVVRETDVAYLLEYRTGFPFGVVNEDGFLIGRPDGWRLPAYFNANLSFERRFRFLHYLWAWRVGLINLTNSGNPNVVDNNINSSRFLAYGRGQHRAVNVRLRFLGRR